MGKLEKVTFNNENIYLKRSKLGWRIVYPYKNEDGSWNYKNLILGGSWAFLLKIIFITLALYLIFTAYKHDTQECRDTLNHLDRVCAEYKTFAVTNNSIQLPIIPYPDINPNVKEKG